MAATMISAYRGLTWVVTDQVRKQVYKRICEEAINFAPDEDNKLYSDEALHTMIKLQLDAYTTEHIKVEPTTESTFNYWKESSYYHLQPIARMQLCIPASSAVVEPCFSGTAFIQSRREPTLGLTTLESNARIRHFIKQDEEAFQTLFTSVMAEKHP